MGTHRKVVGEFVATDAIRRINLVFILEAFKRGRVKVVDFLNGQDIVLEEVSKPIDRSPQAEQLVGTISQEQWEKIISMLKKRFEDTPDNFELIKKGRAIIKAATAAQIEEGTKKSDKGEGAADAAA